MILDVTQGDTWDGLGRRQAMLVPHRRVRSVFANGSRANAHVSQCQAGYAGAFEAGWYGRRSRRDELPLDKALVDAVFAHQSLVRALLRDDAALEHDHAIGVRDCR